MQKKEKNNKTWTRNEDRNVVKDGKMASKKTYKKDNQKDMTEKYFQLKMEVFDVTVRCSKCLKPSMQLFKTNQTVMPKQMKDFINCIPIYSLV